MRTDCIRPHHPRRAQRALHGGLELRERVSRLPWPQPVECPSPNRNVKLRVQSKLEASEWPGESGTAARIIMMRAWHSGPALTSCNLNWVVRTQAQLPPAQAGPALARQLVLTDRDRARLGPVPRARLVTPCQILHCDCSVPLAGRLRVLADWLFQVQLQVQNSYFELVWSAPTSPARPRWVTVPSHPALPRAAAGAELGVRLAT